MLQTSPGQRVCLVLEDDLSGIAADAAPFEAVKIMKRRRFTMCR